MSKKKWNRTKTEKKYLVVKNEYVRVEKYK